MNLVKGLVLSLILLLPMGQFGRLVVGGENVNLYLNEVLLALIIFFYLVFSLASRRSLKLPPLSSLIFLFLGVALVSLLHGLRFLNFNQGVVSFLYLARFSAYVGLYFVVWDLASAGSRKVAVTMLKLLVFSGVLLALLGFIQLQIFPDFSSLEPQLGWDPHKNRLLSTFFDPNFLAAFFVLSLSLTASLILFRIQGISRFSFCLAWLVIFVALILTFSRSGYLMFAISVAVIGILKSRRLLFLSIIAFLMATFFVPRVQTRITGGVDPDDSARFRIVSWKNTLEIIKDYPVAGVGFNAYRYAQERYGYFDFTNPSGGRAGAGSDSSLLFVWATTGIFGLLTFIFLLLSVVFMALSNFFRRSATPLLKATSLTLLAGGSGLLVESNFINSLFYPWIMEWVFLVLGIMVALSPPERA